jgi:predicted GNAT family acetyltransferase
MRIRALQSGDEAQLEAFLSHHYQTSMFLRSNVRQAGLLDRGNAFEATYVAALENDEIVAVVAHCWNGMLLFQAPVYLELVLQAAIAHSKRPILGIAGPWQQVQAANQQLNPSFPLTLPERLFSLSLSQLHAPKQLSKSGFHVRYPQLEEFDQLTEWRVSYEIETLNRLSSPHLWERCRNQLDRLQAQQAHWVLEVDNTIVSYCAFTAQLPDAVQLGGVWTPPEHRNRGHARCVVAGALLTARDAGVEQAILFTGHDNAAAQCTYRQLGFQLIGEYGLVLCNPSVCRS